MMMMWRAQQYEVGEWRVWNLLILSRARPTAIKGIPCTLVIVREYNPLQFVACIVAQCSVLFSPSLLYYALAQNEIFCLYQKVMLLGGHFCTLQCFCWSQVDACDLLHTQQRWGPEFGAIKGIAGRQFVTDLMRRTRKFEKGSAPFSSSLSWSTLSTLSSLSCPTTSS